MHTRGELDKLIIEAQRGCEASRDRLSKLVRVPLEEYVYRLTLDNDTTQDIVQETMVTMFKVLGQLRKTDRFWPWLYRIAFRKMLDVQKEQKHHKEILAQIPQPTQLEDPEGLANIVNQELQQIVMQAMREIRPRHRQVLTLRCYAELEYKEIAEAMQCSEFGVRMLFWRAKNALQKQLSRRGFKKGAFLTALVVFGKMTSRSEASAAQTTVTAGSLKVRMTAAAAGALGTKAGIVTVLAAGILTMGAGLTFSGKLQSLFPSTESSSFSGHPISWQTTSAERDRLKELWYYYPDGLEGPLILRAVASNDDSGYSYCQWLQNDRYNYFYDRRKNTVFLTNHRLWQQDLSVLRLPTDPPEFTAFLCRVEGKNPPIEPVQGNGPGLWIVVKNRTDSSVGEVWVTRDVNIMKAEFFQSPWSAEVNQIDHRDLMHQRGWTYFMVTGEIQGKPVQGRGRIPFVAAAMQKNSPWFWLAVGDQVIVHSRSMPEGSFFRGLPRPWTGLHTIDTVRRDAAAQKIRFETQQRKDDNRVQIILSGPERTLIYTIDLRKDVIEKIELLNLRGEREGELIFTYFEELGQDPREYMDPRSDGYGVRQRQGQGILWLWELAKD